MNRTSSTRNLIFATIILSVLLVAGTYRFLVLPTMDSTALLQSETAAAEATNSETKSEIAALRELKPTLNDLRNNLETLRVRLPADTELDTFYRYVRAQAEKNDVTVTSLNFGPPKTLGGNIVGGTADARSAENTRTDDSDVASTESSAAEATLYKIPVAVKLVGPLDGIHSFLASLRDTEARAALLHSLTVVELGDQPGTYTVQAGLSVFTAPAGDEVTEN